MRRVWLLLMIVLIGGPWQGCRSSGHEQILEQQEELHFRLLRYSDSFSQGIQSAAERIRAETDDPAIIRKTIRWKVMMIPACRDAVMLQEPVRALIDVWTLTIQMEQYFATQHAKEGFGPGQEIALTISARLVEGIDRIANDALGDEFYAQAADDVEKFAVAHAILVQEAAVLELPSVAVDDESTGYFQWVDRIPLSLGSLVGLDKSAQAIHELAQSTDRFTNMASHLPEQLQWNAELLLLDMGIEETSRNLSAQAQLVAESAARFATTTENWSRDAERVIDAALDSVDRQHAPIAENLATLQKATEDVRLGAEGVQASILELGRVIENTAPVVGSVQEAATALASATDSVERTARVIFPDRGKEDGEPEPEPEPEDPDAPAKRPFDVTEYTAAAAQIEAASDEVRALLEDIKAFGASPEFDETLGTVQGRTRDTVDHTSVQARALVDHITIRVIQIVAVLLAGTVLFLWIRSRMARDRAGT